MSTDRGYGFAPGKLWSLWEMLELKADRFMHLLHVMQLTEDAVTAASGALPAEVMVTNITAADTIKLLCEEMGLLVSARSTEYVRVAKTGADLQFGIRHAKSTIHHELQGQIFYAPNPAAGKYFRQARCFGEEVWTNFPSANDDIYEAGMCLALDRPTACVMHLMRVIEAGLHALGVALGVAQQNDWGSYLREIEKALKARMAASGARSPDEQFFAEAAAQIDNVRRAYRNPTMHPDRSYSFERAEEIFGSSQSLMRHLATKLHE
jgi:hypothetical protein